MIKCGPLVPSVSQIAHLGKICLIFLLSVGLSACAGKREMSLEKRQDAAQYNAQLGAEYFQRGELDQAREKLLKSLNQDNRNPLAHISYAKLQDRVGKKASANKHFKRALLLDPEEPEHRNSYGIYLCNIKHYDKAQEEFRKAADNPYYKTPEFALDNAGLCMLDAGRLVDAEGFLREALRVNPTFANAYLHMADLLHRSERISVADAYYQRFEAYGSETAKSLWLGVKIKRDTGDTDIADSFASQLLNQFPASREAGEYLSRNN